MDLQIIQTFFELFKIIRHKPPLHSCTLFLFMNDTPMNDAPHDDSSVPCTPAIRKHPPAIHRRYATPDRSMSGCTALTSAAPQCADSNLIIIESFRYFFLLQLLKAFHLLDLSGNIPIILNQNIDLLSHFFRKFRSLMIDRRQLIIIKLRSAGSAPLTSHRYLTVYYRNSPEEPALLFVRTYMNLRNTVNLLFDHLLFFQTQSYRSF